LHRSRIKTSVARRNRYVYRDRHRTAAERGVTPVAGRNAMFSIVRPARIAMIIGSIMEDLLGLDGSLEPQCGPR
jgi:hypothetical protein